MSSERFEIDVSASPAQVWDRLTTSEGLASWFGTDADVELRVGGERTVRWGDDMQIDAVITDIDGPHRLRLAYVADDTEVGAEEWLINDGETTTRVTLITSMRPDDDNGDWEGFAGDVRRGWRLFLASMRFALGRARQPDRVAECRHLPAIGRREEIWQAVQRFLDSSELVDGLTPVLVDAPHSRLFVADDRSLLIDVEGAGSQQVLYAQAATHDGPDAWRNDVLDGLDATMSRR